MPIRSSSAVWEGDLKDGKGRMKVGNGAYEGPYTFVSRFESGAGTNPEELVAAAHAGCFSMAFSHILAEAGHTPTRISTTANVHLEKVGDGFRITSIDLVTEGVVPGIDASTFQTHAETARQNCPVSLALTGVALKVRATLKS